MICKTVNCFFRRLTKDTVPYTEIICRMKQWDGYAR